MASTPYAAYRVMHSSGAYGAATPYAVVSVAAGMPHMPAHSSKEAAQRDADRLNEEVQHEAGRLKEAAQRRVTRLQDEARMRDSARESEPT